MRDMTERHEPRVLPPTWRRDPPLPPGHPLEGLVSYTSTEGLHVLLSAGLQDDGKWWLHVSVTAPRRVPYYGELCEVKAWFVGRERQAVQLFPSRSKHINIHPNCLHLWACLDEAGDGLPDFGKAGTI